MPADHSTVFESLTPAQKLTLEFEALLPHDQIPLPWLRALVAKTFPAASATRLDDAWNGIVQPLFKLGLLEPDPSQPRLALIDLEVRERLLQSFPPADYTARHQAVVDYSQPLRYSVWRN